MNPEPVICDRRACRKKRDEYCTHEQPHLETVFCRRLSSDFNCWGKICQSVDLILVRDERQLEGTDRAPPNKMTPN